MSLGLPVSLVPWEREGSFGMGFVASDTRLIPPSLASERLRLSFSHPSPEGVPSMQQIMDLMTSLLGGHGVPPPEEVQVPGYGCRQLPSPLRVGGARLCSLLQMRTLRIREVESLAQGRTSGPCGREGLEARFLTPRPELSQGWRKGWRESPFGGMICGLGLLACPPGRPCRWRSRDRKRGVGWSGGDGKGVWPCSYPITTGGLELSLPFSEPHSFQL